MEASILSFLPMFIMQAIYAVLMAQIAKRTKKNVSVYVILSLIPFFGAFFFIYVMWSTVLWILDSINELRAKKSGVVE